MRSKSNRKGFTMTELIATLVILGIVVAIAIPGVGALQAKFKEDYYKQLSNSVLAAAKTYYKDNTESRPSGDLSIAKLEYSDLIRNKYIDSINQYNKDEKCNGYVAVLKANNKLIYKNCMFCVDHSTVENVDDIQDLTLLTSEHNKKIAADSNICKIANRQSTEIKTEYNTTNLSNNPLYIYRGNYSPQELKEELKIGEKVSFIVKEGDDKSILAYEVETGKDIYPKNITGVNLNKVTMKDGVNVGTKVTYDGDKDRQIYVYEYEEPNVENTSEDIPYRIGQLVSSATNYVNLSLKPIKFNSEEGEYPKGKDLSPLVDSAKAEFTRYLYKINDDSNNWKVFSEGEGLTPSVLLSEILKNSNYSLNDKIKFKMEGRRTNSSKSLYSKETAWYGIKSIVTVTFDLNDDNADVLEENTKKYENGSIYGVLPEAINKGHKFEGWFKGKSGGQAINSDDTVIGDHTLYAQWTKNRYIITLDVNGGDPLPVDKDKIEKEYMSTCGTLPTPTRTGHTFSGWWTDKNGGFKVSANKQIENHITMYARWNRNTYRLIFDPNGGTLNEPFYEIEYDAEYGYLPTPIRTGYSFKGWWTDKNGGTEVSKGKKMGDGNTTIYARWEADTYTITFDANGGFTPQTKKTVVYDSNYGEMPVATRSGNIFKGWYTAITGGKKIESTAKVNITSNDTFYALWEEVAEIELSYTNEDKEKEKCSSDTDLVAGVYYIEIVGGGAGSRGKSGGDGGNAARWAGYIYLPNINDANVCIGKGSFGKHGEFFWGELINGDVVNGHSTYIANTSKTIYYIEAMGGITFRDPYTDAINKFYNTQNSKLVCNNVIGEKRTSANQVTYGCGALGRQGGGFGNGSDGTPGYLYLKYEKPLSAWDLYPSSCPSTPHCNTSDCGWVNWPTS